MPRLTIAEPNVSIDLTSNAPGANKAQLDQWLKASLGGFTTEELNAAFDTVKDKAHWKNPIDAIVEAGMRDVLNRAIPYYTGTLAEFDEVEGQPGMLRVTADGYFGGRCN